jgi:hypothetical protein
MSIEDAQGVLHVVCRSLEGVCREQGGPASTMHPACSHVSRVCEDPACAYASRVRCLACMCMHVEDEAPCVRIEGEVSH